MSEKKKSREKEGRSVVVEGRDSLERESLYSLLREIARDSNEVVVSGSAARLALPRVGAVIAGKYRLEERLGEGGMGVVFRARHELSGKQVAIKWMLPGASESVRAGFVREARAAGRIDHPNVVDIYDIEHEEDTFLVMELLRGEPLARRLGRGPLDVEEVTRVMLPALRGVAAAHARGVIHRDLKPENVFLCEGPDGVEREPKVLDFGISKLRSDGGMATTLTREGRTLGTPAYMSPEQLGNAPDLDERTDVYAAGVMMYEALSGRLPFRGDSDNAVIMAIGKHEPEPLGKLRPDLPRALEQVVMRAMAKRREARFPTMNALIEALAPFAPGAGRFAAPGARARVGPPLVRRHRRLWAGLALLAAAALAAWLLWRIAGETWEQPPPLQGSSSQRAVE